MRPLLALVLVPTLLFPAPALAGNDYPGGGLGAPAQPGPPVVTSDATTPPPQIADPTVLLESTASPLPTGPVIQLAPDGGGVLTATGGGLPAATTARASGSVTSSSLPSGGLPTGVASGRSLVGPGSAASPAQLFPSAAQPTTSSAPGGPASVTPGQLYPSAAQPTTSSAPGGPASVTAGQLYPSATQPGTSSMAAGGAALSPGQLYPSAAQPTTSSAARPIGAISATTGGSVPTDPNAR